MDSIPVKHIPSKTCPPRNVVDKLISVDGKEEAKTFPVSSIGTFFEKKGKLARPIGWFAPRCQQIDMAKAVEKSLTDGTHLIVEAGTGVGKSLAYLFPAALWAVQNKKKVVIATYTKALQEQLVQKDLPVVQSVLKKMGQEFRFALLMGSENYLCLERLHRSVTKGPELFGADYPSQTLKNLLQWSERSVTGLKSKIPFPVNGSTWELVCRDADLCLGKKGSFADSCLYKKDLLQARQADLVVVNQHLFFSGLSVLRFDAVVFDEAHNLPEVVAQFLGFSLTTGKLKRLLDDIYNPASGRGLAKRLKHKPQHWFQEIEALLQEARTASEGFFENVRTTLKLSGERDQVLQQQDLIPFPRAKRVKEPGFVPDTLTMPLERLSGQLSRAITSQTSAEEEMEIDHTTKRYQEFIAQLNNFLECKSKEHAYWAEVQESRRGVVTSLNMAPLDVSGPLRKDLFEKPPTVVLTSATLAVNGSFKMVKSRLGMDGGREVLLDSPFDYENRTVLYTNARFPDPRSDGEGYEKEACQFCIKLAEFVPGGIFLLFTSWSFLNKAYRTLEASVKGRPLFKQGDQSPFELVANFKKSGRGVLFGTDTFWQGVDVPGPALSCVVITRLPFLSPSNPLEEARYEWMTTQGKDVFQDYVVPNAVIKFRQGFGRLIRNHTDFGAVAVLDPRIRTRPYGPFFLRSIPACRHVGSINELEEFFESKKTAEAVGSAAADGLAGGGKECAKV